MKYKVIILLCLFLILDKVKGQDIPVSLTRNLESVGMKFTPHEQYSIARFENEFGENACEDESCPIKGLDMVHAKLTHRDEQCKILIYCTEGKLQNGFKNQEERSTILSEHPTALSYNRIKSNFMYGLRFRAATNQERKDLDMMLHYYTKDTAKSIFNADYMVSYPYNMQGKKCEDKYTCAKAIVTGKGGFDIFVYFLLTDEGADNFEKYLSDFSKTLWFE